MSYLLRGCWLLLLCCLCSSALAAEKLTVAAASDLRFALNDILQAFTSQYPEQTSAQPIQVIYGSSGKISQQIRQSAPFDVFFSADQRFTQELYQAGLTRDAGTLFASGRLVLWSAKHDMRGVPLADLTLEKYHKIAIAQPSHAPYGERAKQSLQTAGVWSQLAPKLVFGENIAQTAQLAQSGAADVAIIALSLVKNPHLAASATNNNHAEHYQLLDEATYQPLLQTYTLTHSGAQKPRALQLLKFMQSQQAQQILLHYGFELPKPDLTQ